MRFWLDTEFIERGPQHPIELISIGITSEDGREFYAISSEFDPSHASDWVKENVLAHLEPLVHREHLITIGNGIREFVNPEREGLDKPEFWGYYCVGPATRVLTSDLRWVRIDSLSIGDTLAGFDEEAPQGKGRSKRWRAWRESTVEAIETIKRPCYDLTFSDGTFIRCSAEHKWLTANQEAARWTTTESLRCAKKIASNVVKPVDVWEEINSRDAGYLAAAFDAEGHITQRDLSDEVRGQFSYRLGFAQKNNPMLVEVKRILKEYGYRPTAEQVVDGVNRINLGKREEVMRFLGEMRPRRLLPKFDIGKSGAMAIGKTVKLVSKVDVGRKPVVSIKTTTKTFIAEGLASHNCDYDWVVFCQLFGTMMDLPKGFPMFCMDIKQLCVEKGNPRLPEQGNGEHNALADARWNKIAWEFLNAQK